MCSDWVCRRSTTCSTSTASPGRIPRFPSGRRAGREAEARELLRRLVEAGPVADESQGRAAAINQLYAECLLDEGKYAEAEQILRRVLGDYEKLYPDHWLQDWARSDLGAALLGQKKYEEAQPRLRRAARTGRQ